MHFLFFLQTSLLLSVNLEIELGLTSSGSASELSSTPHLRLDEHHRIFRQRTKTRASERQLSLRISASVPVYGERKVRRSLIMEHHRCLLRVFVGFGYGVGTLPEVPASTNRTRKLLCNLRFCSLKEKLPKRRKTRLSVRRKLLPAHLQIFFSGFSQ